MTGPAKNRCQALDVRDEGRKVLIAFFVFSSFVLSASAAHAATLIGVSSVSAIQKGETVPIEWYLDTEDEHINAVELELAFSPDTIQITAEPGRSAISLWVKTPTADQKRGVVSLSGGVPGGVHGVIPLFRTNVTGVANGPAVFALTPSAHVYLNDGFGTAEVIHMPQLQLSVVASVGSNISSPSHPDQNKWYTANSAVLTFPYDQDKAYSYTFTPDFNQFPDNTPEETSGSVSYPNLVDSVYYFRLAEISKTGATQDKGVYRIQIDRTAPEAFVPVIATSTDLFGGAPFLSWNTVDKTSGLAQYKMRSGLFGWWKSAVSPTQVTRPFIGDSIRIRAYDRAGNTRDVVVVSAGYVRTPVFLVLIFVALLVSYVAYNRKKRRTS